MRFARPAQLMLVAGALACALVPDGTDAAEPRQAQVTNPHEGSAERPVSSPATVDSVSGQVLRAAASGWVAVRQGEVLGEGTRVQVLRGAALVLRFDSGETMRFEPGPTGETVLVVVQKRAPRGH